MGADSIAPAGDCRRARAWISLRVDGELSDVETARLDRHLASCPPCLDFDARLGTTTELLRTAPLERPARRFEVPRVARPALRARRFALAAAVASAAALGGLVGGNVETPSPPEEAPTQEISLLSQDEDAAQLRRLPRSSRTPAAKPPPPATNPREGLV